MSTGLRQRPNLRIVNSYIFIQEKTFDDVVWKMATILLWSQCVLKCTRDFAKYRKTGRILCVHTVLWFTMVQSMLYIYIYIYIGMALFVRGHRWPPNPPVAPQSTGGPLKNRWPLQILAHSFGRILRHLYFTNIWNKLTLTTVHTHTETFMGTSHSLNVYRWKDHSMKDIFHKNGSLF